MRIHRLRDAATAMAVLARGAWAQNLVYITDLDIFTSLAPCAASAISANIMSQTRSNCPEAVGDMQACVCSRTSALSPSISSSISYSCGSTASDDHASASTVLKAYCSQQTAFTFPKPSFSVSQYITDFPEVENLAPCAISALSYVVQSMTNTYCPFAPTDLAACACNKNQNSLRISQLINTSVKYSCSTHLADITSAQQIFSAYCNLALSGTSAFPVASPPPGDMSYYITALPQYSALDTCGQSAISFALSTQANEFCPPGVQALASCACLKDGIYGSISSIITASVKWSCSSTASQQIPAALSVLDFYCSAAKNEVKATGVSESVGQVYPTAKTGSISQSSGAAPSDTSQSTDSLGSTTGVQRNTAVIAGSVTGALSLLIGIGVAVYYMMRNGRRKKAAAEAEAAMAPPPSAPAPDFPDYGGFKPELSNTPAVAFALPASPSPSAAKVEAAKDIISPLSPVAHASELHADGHQTTTISPNSPHHGQFPQSGTEPPQNLPLSPHEMQGQQTYSTMIRPELQGQQAYVPHSPKTLHSSINGQQSPLDTHAFKGNTQVSPVDGSGMSWQAGPVTEYAELDGGYSGDHARAGR